MIKAVIFDVDGTLVDTNDLHTAAWVEAFRHFGHVVDPGEVRSQMGKGGDQLMPVLLGPDDVARDGEAIEGYRRDLFHREYLPRARVFAGVRPLFARLHADGLTLVLASSGRKVEIERHMAAAGITDFVAAVTTSEDSEHSKPAPDIFLAALRRIAPIAASDAVVIGDTPYDAEAAGKAGLRSIGVLCGGFDETTLRNAGCVAVYPDAQALLQAYETSRLRT